MELPMVVARSLSEANDELIMLSPRSGVVSIGAPGGEPPYGFQRLNPLHLRLEFHDVGEEFVAEDGLVPPSASHVETLLDHALILRTTELVYVHCAAGISRSTAIAYVLLCKWMGPGREAEALGRVYADRPIAAPNRLLVRHADELMGRGGAMVRALGAYGNEG